MTRNADDILTELLVVQAQRGDAIAVRLLVKQWHVKLLRHARKLTERDDVAADVVQESWLAIFRGLRRLKDPATFRAWAYRIVHHKSVDWIRRQVRERDQQQELGRHVAAQTSDDDSEAVENLQTAMARLPAEQQVLLRMFYANQMSLKEISAVLDTPIGTLKFRLFSLRKQLKELMERENP